MKFFRPAYFIKVIMTIFDFALIRTGEPITIHLGSFFTAFNWYVWEQSFFI